jgi:hypothetical protein
MEDSWRVFNKMSAHTQFGLVEDHALGHVSSGEGQKALFLFSQNVTGRFAVRHCHFCKSLEGVCQSNGTFKGAGMLLKQSFNWF